MIKKFLVILSIVLFPATANSCEFFDFFTKLFIEEPIQNEWKTYTITEPRTPKPEAKSWKTQLEKVPAKKVVAVRKEPEKSRFSFPNLSDIFPKKRGKEIEEIEVVTDERTNTIPID